MCVCGLLAIYLENIAVSKWRHLSARHACLLCLWFILHFILHTLISVNIRCWYGILLAFMFDFQTLYESQRRFDINFLKVSRYVPESRNNTETLVVLWWFYLMLNQLRRIFGKWQHFSCFMQYNNYWVLSQTSSSPGSLSKSQWLMPSFFFLHPPASTLKIFIRCLRK